MSGKMTKKEMPETMYRASRCCRIFGNPTAYLVVRCLNRAGKTPSEIAEELETPIQTVSKTLRNLRHIDVVRYESRGLLKIYWVKDRGILKVLDSLEKWIDKERIRKV